MSTHGAWCGVFRVACGNLVISCGVWVFGVVCGCQLLINIYLLIFVSKTMWPFHATGQGSMMAAEVPGHGQVVLVGQARGAGLGTLGTSGPRVGLMKVSDQFDVMTSAVW